MSLPVSLQSESSPHSSVPGSSTEQSTASRTSGDESTHYHVSPLSPDVEVAGQQPLTSGSSTARSRSGVLASQISSYLLPDFAENKTKSFEFVSMLPQFLVDTLSCMLNSETSPAHLTPAAVSAVDQS